MCSVQLLQEYESMRGSKMIGRSAQTLGSLGVGSWNGKSCDDKKAQSKSNESKDNH